MGIFITVVLLWAAIGGKHPAHTPQGVNGRAVERVGNDGTNSEGLHLNVRHRGSISGT